MKLKQLSSVTLAAVLAVGCGEGTRKRSAQRDSDKLEAGADPAQEEDADAGLLTDGVGMPDAASLVGRDAASPVDRERDSGAPSANRDSGTPPTDAGGTRALRLPPLNADFDYQLGGSYAPDSKVKMVSRDRKETPATGLYNICYVNGFQTQPDEASFWQQANHNDLILTDSKGRPVEDTEWHEQILDIRTADKRTRLAAVVGEWIAGCAAAGFDAIEVDNLDSYTRSSDPETKRPLLSEANAVAFMRLLADRAHSLGLPIAQKNSAELVGRKGEMGTDFAVAEECNQYTECDAYKAGYGNQVLIIEYQRSAFQKGCSAYPELPIVLRDVDLRLKGSSGYVFDGC